jgi:hypothetical protein
MIKLYEEFSINKKNPIIDYYSNGQKQSEFWYLNVGLKMDRYL